MCTAHAASLFRYNQKLKWKCQLLKLCNSCVLQKTFHMLILLVLAYEIFFYKQWWFEECFLTNTRYTYFCIIYSSAVLTVIWLHLFNLKYQICQNMSPFWLTCSPSILIRSRDWSYSVKLIKLTHNCTWSESNNRSCQKSIYFNHNEKKLIKDANPHS